jgi:hypothetical protein
MAEQPVVQRVTGVNAFAADGFQADTIPPTLTSFEFNLDLHILVLSFDEPVKAPLDTSAITLKSNEGAIGTSRTLAGGGYARSADGLVFTVSIDDTDINAITKDEGLGHDAPHTYLSTSDVLVTDMVGKLAEAIPSGAAQNVKVLGYTGDLTDPTLFSFDFDADSRTLVLHFLETMDVSELEMSVITFQSSEDANIYDSYTLNGGSLATGSEDGLTVTAILSVDDMNVLKERGIVRTKATTWLTFEAGAIKDMAGHLVQPLVNGESALQVSGYESDVSPPLLQSFTFDLNDGLLTMTFDETVDAASIRVEGLTFVDPTGGSGEGDAHKLTGGTHSVTDSTIITVIVSKSDLNVLKASNNLAASKETTVLAIDAIFLADTYGIPVAEETAAVASDYTHDITGADLNDFDFNATTGIITLNFTETMDWSTIEPTGFTLQSDAQNPSTAHTLANVIVSPEAPSTVLQLILSRGDLDSVLIDDSLCVSVGSCYLKATNLAVNDTAGNKVVPSISRVRDFEVDKKAPEFDKVSLDLNTGEITLFFSEPVQSSTLDTSKITLDRRESLEGGLSNMSVTLRQGASVTETPNSHTLLVRLNASDLDQVKILMASYDHDNDVVVAIENDAAADMNDNPLIGGVLAVADYDVQPDTTPPIALSFNFDMNRGFMVVEFDEIINWCSLKRHFLSLTNGKEIDEETVQLLEKKFPGCD